MPSARQISASDQCPARVRRTTRSPHERRDSAANARVLPARSGRVSGGPRVLRWREQQSKKARDAAIIDKGEERVDTPAGTARSVPRIRRRLGLSQGIEPTLESHRVLPPATVDHRRSPHARIDRARIQCIQHGGLRMNYRYRGRCMPSSAASPFIPLNLSLLPAALRELPDARRPPAAQRHMIGLTRHRHFSLDVHLARISGESFAASSDGFRAEQAWPPAPSRAPPSPVGESPKVTPRAETIIVVPSAARRRPLPSVGVTTATPSRRSRRPPSRRWSRRRTLCRASTPG